MGAIIHTDGVAFRVWAPHAEGVAVVGTFNDWDATRHPMTREDGNWFVDVREAAPGDEYRFELATPSGTLSRIDPYAQAVTNSVGNGVIYDHSAYDWRGDDFTLTTHDDLVIYEMHVGSFFAPDESRPGTFTLVVEKLHHLVKLGVSAIQLMPVAEFAGDYSWGYNPAHLFAVESAYGGPERLKDLVRAAHAAGLAVILDVVYNHFGPTDLDLWRFDGWHENDGGGIYFYNDHRSTTPWGDTRPDYGREEVRNFIRDNALMWLRDYRLDGLRWDMTPYIRTIDGGTPIPEGWTLMQWVTDQVREQAPHAILIAEDLHSEPAMTAPTPGGAGFHAQWDARFVHPVREAVIAPMDEWRSAAELVEAISAVDHGDAFRRVIYTESHDEVANGRARVPHEINVDDPRGWHAQKRSTLGAGLVFTAPGIPMIFQGQEFLQGDWFRDDVPLDWDLNDSYRGITRMYRDLIGLRRNRWGTTRGLRGQHLKVFHVNEELNVIAFQRWEAHGPGDDVVVVANFSHAPLTEYALGMPTGGTWSLRFNSDAEVYSEAFDGPSTLDVVAADEPRDGLDASAAITIGAYSLLVYSQPTP